MITDDGTQTAADQWAEVLDGLLSADAAASRAGVDTASLERAAEAGDLIVVADRSGRRLYPGCQFRYGWPKKNVVEAWRVVAAATASPRTACSWLVRPDDSLEDRSPLDFAHNGSPERLLTVARQDAARLAS